MVEIPRIVEKLGGSWVIKLDKSTRQMLKITEPGQTIILKEDIDNDPNEISTYE